MSAIDFNMDITREASNKGDRVRLTISGKFPPHKSCGNNDDRPEYGLKS